MDALRGLPILLSSQREQKTSSSSQQQRIWTWSYKMRIRFFLQKLGLRTSKLPIWTSILPRMTRKTSLKRRKKTRRKKTRRTWVGADVDAKSPRPNVQHGNLPRNPSATAALTK